MIISKRSALARARVNLNVAKEYHSDMLSCERKYARESYYLGERITMSRKRELAEEIAHYESQVKSLESIAPNSKVEENLTERGFFVWRAEDGK